MGTKERLDKLEAEVHHLDRFFKEMPVEDYIETLVETKIKQKVRQIIEEEAVFVCVKNIEDDQKRRLATVYETKLKAKMSEMFSDIGKEIANER